MNFFKGILFLFFLCSFQYGMAQKLVASNKEEVKKNKWFFEKIYLHTDRSIYNVGEDIWFSAYLVNGKSAYLTSSSNNLYVELITPESKIADRKIIRLDNGLGKGDFKLPDSISSGYYTIRAYTTWMRNFEDDFVFKKRIYINSDVIVATSKKVMKPVIESLPPSVSTVKNTIQFFPEGGNLVEGITSLVAFKTEDAYGNAANFNGSIISSQGDTINSFQSTNIGMGIFSLTPVAGIKYHVEGYFKDQIKLRFELPEVLKKGLSMHLINDSLNVRIAIGANPATWLELKDKNISISIKHASDEVFLGSVILSKENLMFAIPKVKLPLGLAVITISDNLGRPHCERLFYMDDKNPVKFEVKSNKPAYSSNEKVTLNITANDVFGQPVKGNFSLAVVDNSVSTEESSIVSYLMLQSEIKGEIKNAGQYFDNNNVQRWKQLDLLLLTQGWRSYIWRRLSETKTTLKYMPEPGISLAGKLREKLGDKPIADMNITLFGPNFTDGKLFTTKTDQFGNYYFDGLKWNGYQLIKLTAIDAQGKKRGWLTLDSLLQPLPISTIKIDNVIEPLTLESVSKMTKNLTDQRKIIADNSINLNDVNISASAKKINLFNQVLTTFGYPDQVFDIKSSDYSFHALEHYLLTNALGSFPIPASDTISTEGIVFAVPGGFVKPILMINGKEELTERSDYYGMTMDKIEKLTVKHLLGQGGSDVYLLYIDFKDGALDGVRLDLVNEKMMGYYTARSFYTPNYENTLPSKQDLRTTLFWSPNIQTNDKGEAVVTFYNTDIKTNILIKAEGITEKGIAVATKGSYKIQ